MPKLKINNEWKYFDFDPDKIAKFIYDGYEVQPDDQEALDNEESRAEKQRLLDASLQRLWKPKYLKTDTRIYHQGDASAPNPNPTINYDMPEITPAYEPNQYFKNTLVNNQRKYFDTDKKLV